MTKAVEVITSVQRRRRWSGAEKERIVAGALESGASASEVARAAGIHTSQLFRWRLPKTATFKSILLQRAHAWTSPTRPCGHSVRDATPPVTTMSRCGLPHFGRRFRAW
jgi:transposase